MEPTLFSFIKQNALLIGLAIGSGLTLLWPLLTRGTGGVPDITTTEAVVLMNRSKPLILDVRDEAEFAAGHIQGAKHIPVADLAARLKEIEKFKDKPVMVNCQRGMRSAKACGILKANGFTQVHNLTGGLDAWIAAKMPVAKAKV